MGRKRKRACVYCHKKYIPSPFCHNQKYCLKTEDCRLASNRASSRKYRRKAENRTPEKMDTENERVKKWQKAHPDYKKRQRRRKKRKKIIEDRVLRDLALGENCDEIDVLRDLAFRQHVQLKGLISHLFDVLRDGIGSVENRLYDIGLSVSDVGSETGLSTFNSS